MTARKPAAKKAPAKPAQTPEAAAPEKALAARAETMTEGAQVAKVITWRGMSFSIPPSAEEWPLDVAEAFEDGRVVAAVRGVLGTEQWESMKTKLQPKVKDLNSLAELIGKEYGFETAGE